MGAGVGMGGGGAECCMDEQYRPLPDMRRGCIALGMRYRARTVWCGACMVLTMFTASALISIAKEISSIMSPACMPTMSAQGKHSELRRRKKNHRSMFFGDY